MTTEMLLLLVGAVVGVEFLVPFQVLLVVNQTHKLPKLWRMSWIEVILKILGYAIFLFALAIDDVGVAAAIIFMSMGLANVGYGLSNKISLNEH